MENVDPILLIPTIKDQLIDRFIVARDAAGRNWKTQLAACEPYFNTKAGVDDMNLVAQAIKEGNRRGQVDRIKRVVLCLEKMTGIPHAVIQ